MTEKKGLAIAALALGIGGLFTAGGLGIGSLLASFSPELRSWESRAADAIWRGRPSRPTSRAAHDRPGGGGGVAYRASPAAFASDDDELPEPGARPDQRLRGSSSATPSSPSRPTVEARARDSDKAESKAEAPPRSEEAKAAEAAPQTTPFGSAGPSRSHGSAERESRLSSRCDPGARPRRRNPGVHDQPDGKVVQVKPLRGSRCSPKRRSRPSGGGTHADRAQRRAGAGHHDRDGQLQAELRTRRTRSAAAGSGRRRPRGRQGPRPAATAGGDREERAPELHAQARIAPGTASPSRITATVAPPNVPIIAPRAMKREIAPDRPAALGRESLGRERRVAPRLARDRDSSRPRTRRRS